MDSFLFNEDPDTKFKTEVVTFSVFDSIPSMFPARIKFNLIFDPSTSDNS